VGAEIGIYRGGTSRLLLGEYSDLTLYMVDTWSGEWSGEREYQIALQAVKEYGNRAVIIRGDSAGSASGIKDGALDFVFIDAAHDYHSVRKDIEAWLPKVRDGGLITGHDYGNVKYPGVRKAVDEIFSGVEVYTDGGHDEWGKPADHLIWVVKK
jgi:predicted O-methyltransferase YrrM